MAGQLSQLLTWGMFITQILSGLHQVPALLKQGGTKVLLNSLQNSHLNYHSFVLFHIFLVKSDQWL